MNMKFKKNGIIFLESLGGDMMLADPKIKSELIVTMAALEKAMSDSNYAQKIISNIMKFLKEQRIARWVFARAEHKRISAKDEKFKKITDDFLEVESVENLRLLEKRIYFWKLDNGEFDFKVNTR